MYIYIYICAYLQLFRWSWTCLLICKFIQSSNLPRVECCSSGLVWLLVGSIFSSTQELCLVCIVYSYIAWKDLRIQQFFSHIKTPLKLLGSIILFFHLHLYYYILQLMLLMKRTWVGIQYLSCLCSCVYPISFKEFEGHSNLSTTLVGLPVCSSLEWVHELQLDKAFFSFKIFRLDRIYF